MLALSLLNTCWLQTSSLKAGLVSWDHSCSSLIGRFQSKAWENGHLPKILDASQGKAVVSSVLDVSSKSRRARHHPASRLCRWVGGASELRGSSRIRLPHHHPSGRCCPRRRAERAAAESTTWGWTAPSRWSADAAEGWDTRARALVSCQDL